MKIKSVSIQGMHNVSNKTYNLQNLNYFSGPNGSGKSTAMQAIQLALLGYIPGTAKNKESIFKHANGNIMAVTLLLDDNGSEVEVQRIWTGIKSNVNSTISVKPPKYDIDKIVSDIELPIFNFDEFVGLTANKLKDWFLAFLPKESVKIDWATTLQDDLINQNIKLGDESLIQVAVSNIEEYGLEGVDEIRKANEYFKNCLSFEKKTLEKAQSTIQSLIFYDDADDTTSEEDIRKRISDLTRQSRLRDDYNRILANNALVERDLKSYEDCTAECSEIDPRYADLKSRNDEIVRKLSELPATDNLFQQILDTKNRRAELYAENRTKQEIVNSDGICPFTKTKCQSVQSMINQYRQDILNNKETIESMDREASNLEFQIAEIKASKTQLESELSKITKDLNDLHTRYRMKAQIEDRIQDVPVYEDDGTDYEFELRQLQDMLVKKQANAKYNEMIDFLTAEKFKVEQNIAAYKSWVNLTGVNGLQADDSASKPFWKLADEMDKYIKIVFGQSAKTWFHLESKANSFSFGIMKDSGYIQYNMLSSGERCMFSLAMMLSLSKMSESPLKLIMVDDLFDHLDDRNLQETFNTLKSVDDVQMIFAGVKRVEGDFVIKIQEV